jgi:hypothetical protein
MVGEPEKSPARSGELARARREGARGLEDLEPATEQVLDGLRLRLRA